MHKSTTGSEKDYFRVMRSGWWWQRIHPVFRVVLVVVYFGLAFGVIAYAIAQGTPDSASAQPSVTTEAPVEETTTTQASPPTTQPTTPASGEELYNANCAACHGTELEGGAGPPLDRTSEASELSDARYVLRISEGRGAMPAFADQLTSAEIDEIISYIRAQQGE